MTIELKNFTHIIWDWNGTLLDDAWLCVDVMNGMLKKRGLPLKTVEEYRELFDFPVKDYYAKLGYDFDKEPFDEVGMEFIIKYNKRQDETLLHPEVLEILAAFNTRGFSQNILSAREHNDTNVLVLAASYTQVKTAKEILKAWLAAEQTEERHARRVNQIKDIESKIKGH